MGWNNNLSEFPFHMGPLGSKEISYRLLDLNLSIRHIYIHLHNRIKTQVSKGNKLFISKTYNKSSHNLKNHDLGMQQERHLLPQTKK